MQHDERVAVGHHRYQRQSLAVEAASPVGKAVGVQQNRHGATEAGEAVLEPD